MAQTIDLGSVIGPQGPKGATGAAGTTGPQGPKGDTGAAGPQGSAGAKGETGAAGPQGAAGTKGADGATWLFGTTMPTTQGKTGDFFLNTANNDVYSKAAERWAKTGNIKGATGAQGAKGDTGAQGPKGDTGAVPTFSINAGGHLIATYE